MDTKVWQVDKDVNNLEWQPEVIEAATLLRANELVAFPTETVYGLGANALSSEAVKKIFSAKGRPSDNPLIVHVADQAQLSAFVAEVPETAKKLMSAFWPGPLTLVLKKKGSVLPDEVTSGLATVAVRMPNHPLALALIKATGMPIAAPSANTSGRPSPTNAAHVVEDMHGKIAVILDGGSTTVGVESTVLDCTDVVPTVLRPGSISKEQLEAIVGHVETELLALSEEEAPKAPGMKYTHYAPRAAFFLVQGSPAFLQKKVNDARTAGKRVGVYTVSERKDHYAADVVLDGGSEKNLLSIAQKMYATLRSFDQAGVDVIYGEVFPETGIGVAIMNRLRKAASGEILYE